MASLKPFYNSVPGGAYSMAAQFLLEVARYAILE